MMSLPLFKNCNRALNWTNTEVSLIPMIYGDIWHALTTCSGHRVCSH